MSTFKELLKGIGKDIKHYWNWTFLNKPLVHSMVIVGRGLVNSFTYYILKPIPHTDEGFTYIAGSIHVTNKGDLVRVYGHTTLKGYECLICSDGIYRYDRSTGNGCDGRCTGSLVDAPHNFMKGI